MRSHRWIAVVVVGLAVLLLAGAGSYLGARGFRGSQASQSCDVYKCIPRLKAATVVQELRGKGYACEQNSNHWDCKASIGPASFRASLQVSEDLITRIVAEIRHLSGDDVTATPPNLAFLNWFATIPYAGDKATSAQIEDWLAEQVAANEETEAKISDYRYTLTRPDTLTVALRIEGDYS